MNGPLHFHSSNFFLSSANVLFTLKATASRQVENMMGNQIKEAKITTTPMLLIRSFYISTYMQNVVEASSSGKINLELARSRNVGLNHILHMGTNKGITYWYHCIAGDFCIIVLVPSGIVPRSLLAFR